MVAKSLAAFYQQERRTLKVLDVGAGTGLVGVETVMTSSFLPDLCFLDIYRRIPSLKPHEPGGIICMIARTGDTGNSNLSGYRDQCKVVTKQLQKDRKLEKIKWEKVQYYRSTEGIIMAYRVLQ
ncbi:uncharacterized protein LOC110461200 [Mizuhopecten yessoensis]|uniref:uncharacterized protein LOC110461200 n=1 Tax=Mizuhopecten yessoensis TaxID=6573 RepID=UPI000B4580CA|nr:uncharacterized protein LOC110461200 [Mizuhopecten yessoensis]